MEAKRLAVTLASLKEQRSDSHCDKIWEELLVKADEFDCEEPVLPCRRAPKRIDEASSTTHFYATLEDMYHRYYFEVLDTLIGEIECRFESSSFTFYAKVEKCFGECCHWEEHFYQRCRSNSRAFQGRFGGI